MVHSEILRNSGTSLELQKQLNTNREDTRHIFPHQNDKTYQRDLANIEK
jgi:hypothetical protein